MSDFAPLRCSSVEKITNYVDIDNEVFILYSNIYKAIFSTIFIWNESV